MLQDMNFSRATTGEEGLELLGEIRRLRPRLPVILITAWGSIALAVEGMKAGAADFVTKPWSQRPAPAGGRDRARRSPPAGRTAGAPRLSREELDRRFDFRGLIGARSQVSQDPRADRPGGADRRLGAHHRRERHGQGADRRGDPPQQPAQGRAVRQGEPGRHLLDPLRERDVRPRQRRLHRRPGGPQGALRDGRRRHHLPRRDRRDRSRGAGEAAARAPGPLLRGAGVEPHAHRGRAGGLGHQPRPRGDGGEGAVPRGPPLPAEPDRRAAAAPCASGAGTSRCSPGTSSTSARAPTGGAASRSPTAPWAGSQDQPWPGNIRQLKQTIERAVLVRRRRPARGGGPRGPLRPRRARGPGRDRAAQPGHA